MFKLLKQHRTSILAATAEIIIVFVGISISLWIDDWREENANRESEKVYLEEMYYETTQDLITYSNKSFFLSTVGARISLTLETMHFPDSLQTSQIDFKRSMGKLLILETFVSKDHTFNDLTNTGNMKLITDIELRKKMYSYYSEVKRLNNLEDINNKATSDILTSRLMEAFPMRQLLDYGDWYKGIEELTNFDMAFFKDPHSEKYIQLENALLLRASLIRFQARAYDRTSGMCYELRESLGKILGIPNEIEFVEEFLKGNESAEALFEKYRNQFPGYTLIETIINDKAYEIMEKNPKKALELLKLNAKIYTDSSNVFDSIGDCYLVLEDKSNALLNFKKAVEIDGGALETIKKIKLLEEELNKK